eukprot:jgi/Chlat1/3951/Chrsp26S04203
MAVHFKFKSAKDYDSIGLDGHFISVGDLKQAIVTSKGLAKGADFDLLLTNAQTNEEYEDEAFLIPKNTSVIVKRVPSTRPKGFNAARTDIDRDLFTAQSAVAPAQQAAVGDEASKILAMVTETAADWQSRQLREPSSVDEVVVVASKEEDFKAHRGGRRRLGMSAIAADSQCPTNGDTSYDVRRVKFPVGIPRSMLVPNAQGSLLLPSGEVASIRPNEAAFAKQTVGLPSFKGQDGLSPELACPLCEGLFRDAVMIPCCQNSFCDSCIRDYLLEHGECPSCGAKNVKNDNLLPNLTLRKAIDGYMRTMQTQMKTTPASKPGLPAASAQTLAVASAPGSPDGQAQAVRSAGATSAARSAASLLRTTASATSEVEGADDSVSVAPVDKSQVRPNGQHAVSGDGQLSPPSSGGVGVEPKASVANARVPDDTQPGLADARKASSNKPALSTHTGGSVGLQDAIATVQVDSPAKRAKLAEKVDRRCFNCGSASHVARECPNRPMAGMPPRPFFEPGMHPGMMMPPGGMDPMFGMMHHGFPGMPYDGPPPFHPGMGFMPHPGPFPSMGPGPGFPGFMIPPRMPMGPHASWAGRPPLSKEEFLRLQEDERRKRRAAQSRSAGAVQSGDDEHVPSRSRLVRPEEQDGADVERQGPERKRCHAAPNKVSSRAYSDEDANDRVHSRSRQSRPSPAEEDADVERCREEERRSRQVLHGSEYERQSSDDHDALPSRSRHVHSLEEVDAIEHEDEESRRIAHGREYGRPMTLTSNMRRKSEGGVQRIARRLAQSGGVIMSECALTPDTLVFLPQKTQSTSSGKMKREAEAAALKMSNMSSGEMKREAEGTARVLLQQKMSNTSSGEIKRKAEGAARVLPQQKTSNTSSGEIKRETGARREADHLSYTVMMRLNPSSIAIGTLALLHVKLLRQSIGERKSIAQVA